MGLLEIGADDAAANRRRAEYVVLRLLNERSEIACDDLDRQVATVHDRLLNPGHDSPFYFQTGGSNGPESRELNESIERLLRYGKINLTEDRCYHLTREGRDYLDNTDRLERDRIDPQFRDALADVIPDTDGS